MRPVSETLAERLNDTQQTIENNANPATHLRITRNDVPLHEKDFIERVRIVRTSSELTDSSIAVKHPKFLGDDEDIWVAYCQNDTLHIKHAKNTEVIQPNDWQSYSFTDDAVACAICFDSVAKKNTSGIWEFVTEQWPWVFWVTPSGVLYAKMCTPVGVMAIELAVANVTDVSAVRGPASDTGNWDLGMTVFFVMNGDLYYRQYIDGEWYDAELVNNSVVNDLTIQKIQAFNTWDYRVGVQILTSNNDLYELYSFCEGIGARGTEHLEMGVSGVGQLFRVQYSDGYVNPEHISMSLSASGGMTYGLSTVPVSAENIPVSGDYGHKVKVTMDYPNTGGSAGEFILRDSNGIIYSCESVSVNDTEITLTFVNFNLAYSASYCEVVYTQGTLMSPVVATDSFTIQFVPTGLVNPSTPPPSVVQIYNL